MQSLNGFRQLFEQVLPRLHDNQVFLCLLHLSRPVKKRADWTDYVGAGNKPLIEEVLRYFFGFLLAGGSNQYDNVGVLQVFSPAM